MMPATMSSASLVLKVVSFGQGWGTGRVHIIELEQIHYCC